MTPLRSNITFRMNTEMKDRLKEFSHSIGLQLPELIEIICDITTYEIEENENLRQLLKEMATAYKKSSNREMGT